LPARNSLAVFFYRDGSRAGVECRMAPARWFARLALCLVCLSTGCATTGSPSRMWTWLQSGGGPDDDNTPEYQDKWALAGQEGRGLRQMEDEHDPFNKWLRSPKAAAIENNLGIK
jgi:hypothetical protein